jgi:hypothetical protein
MSNIIDELVVLVKLDGKPLKKGLDDQIAAVQQAKKKINISNEDQERIETSRAQRAKEREGRQEKERKGRDRERAKSTQELGDKVKDIAFGVAGVVLGFDTLKGAVSFLGNLSTSTAALGRTSQNLGQSSVGLQAWGNAVQLAGGDAKEAQSSFAALSQQMTAFKLRGDVGPLLALAQNNGVYTRDAEGNTKSIDQLLPQIVDAVRARYSRADAFNLLSNAGVSEGLFNLLADPNRDQYLAKGRSTAFADADKVAKAQKVNATLEGFKQDRTQDIAEAFAYTIDHPLKAYLNTVAFPITGTYGLLKGGATDLYNAAFGEKGATVGVRNNNPGNLMDRSGHLRSFSSMAEGDSAMSSDLDYKIDRDGLNTIRKILSKYNPKTLDKNGVDTNHLAEYIDDVSKRAGFDPDAPITSREQRFLLHDAMIRHEQGKAGAAQVTRAISTPGAGLGGGDTTNGGDTTLHVGSIQVNAPNARDANGVASGITSALYGRLPDQANTGITP